MADISFTELQDNTCYYELAFPEEWGLCEPGEAQALLDGGQTTPVGRMPIFKFPTLATSTKWP